MSLSHPSQSTLPTRAPIGLCMGMPKSFAWAGVGQTPAAGRRMKHRAELRRGFAQVLPTQNYVGTAWAGPSTAHALRVPTFLLGHARLGPDWACPIICLGMLQLWQAQSVAWACPIGHAQAGRWASPSTWAAVGLAHPLPNQRGHECGKPMSAQVEPESSPCRMLTGEMQMQIQMPNSIILGLSWAPSGP